MLFFSACSFSVFAQSITIKHGEFNDDLRQLAQFENIELLKINFSTDSIEGRYNLIAVTVTPDSISEELLSVIMPIRIKNGTEFNVMAKPLDTDSVKISVMGTNYPARVHSAHTPNSIIFEYTTQTEFNVGEEIPLFAYAQGKKFETEWNGQLAIGFNYCKVRDSGKHPSEWGKEFNLPTYVYYTLRPVQ